VRLAMLPLEPGPNQASLAESISREAAAQLLRLKGGTRARLSVIPWSDVIGRHVNNVEKARAALGATHVLRGTVNMENDKVVVHAFLTDARTQANNGEWKAEYAPGEVRYAPVAMAGMVTAGLRLPALAITSVNAAANQNYLAGLAYTRRNSTVDKALPLLESAVAADPDSPLTWAGLADAQWFKYFTTKDPAWLDRTSESLRQAQGRNPDLLRVHIITGLLRANAGLYEQAEAEYQRALELDPANSEAYRRLGQIYERNGQLDRALAAFRRAVELDPGYFKPYQDLGTYYLNRGDSSQALLQFQECVRLAPDEPDTHWAFGLAYYNLGRFAEAERELRLAIGLGETPTALNSLASTLMRQGKDRDAIPYLTRALSRFPDRYLWWMNLGTAYRRTNQAAESEKAYRRSLDLAEKEAARDPRDGAVRARLAFLSARLGDRPRAASEIAQALRLFPEDEATQDLAVQTYEALGRREDALAILRTSSDQVLADAARWPDLADLHQDSRFQELVAMRKIK